MKLEVSYEEADGYLLAKIKGKWDPEALSRVIQHIASIAKERKYTRVLINAFELSAPETDFHRYLAGKDLSKFFGYAIKVVAVYPKELINKFTENTAVNLGVQLSIQSDIDEALAWLMAGTTTKQRK